MNDTTKLSIHMIVLVALCGILYFPYLGSAPLFDKGEPREAMAVQDIVQRGEWLVPLKRAMDIPSKPPLFHWSAALTSRLAGKLDEATLRFPSAIYATLGVLGIYALGRKLFGSDVALLGGAILATTQIYENQALSARVDMTLCFVVTTSLVFFYALYRGFLTHRLWYFAFYALVGIGTLAKGPLGILLPGLVAGAFLALKKKWDLLSKFCFHPGVLLMILLGAGWYMIALTRGGEGFVDRQLLEENLERFFGGSGHNHPFYYYIPYLFSQGLLWSFFLPFLLWDSFKEGFRSDEGRLFLKLWFWVMFAFFSMSMGKRPVYLLPLYPALSLLMADWFYHHGTPAGGRLFFYRSVAVIGGLAGLLLFVITLGALWNHEPGWFFAPIESLVEAKDRANIAVVRNALGTFGWLFTVVSLLAAALWFSLAHCLWTARLRPVIHRLVLISILFVFVSYGVVIPVIAEAKSYRAFMTAVNERVKPDDKLYLYGRALYRDPIEFYRGGSIDKLEQPPESIAGKIGRGNSYLIMAEPTWVKIQKLYPNLPPPLLKSEGKGPDGNVRIILVQAELS
jgi:4-amino-4-deoxy-L-arabinose transferase-like glycosyltransferase